MPPLSQVLDLLLHLVLPAVLASAGVLALLYFTIGAHFARFAAPFAVAAGLTLGNWSRSLLAWQPQSFGYESLLGTAAVVLFGCLAAELIRTRSATTAQFVIPTLIALVAAWIVLPTPIRTPLWFLGTAALFLGNRLVIERRAADQKPPGTAPAFLAMALGGTTALLMLFLMSGKFSELAILLASAMIGLAIVAAILKANVNSALPLAAIYWSALVIASFHELSHEMPHACFVLVAAAPLLLALMLLPPAQRLPLWSRHLIDAVLLALPLLIAVGLMFSTGELSFE